MAKPAKLNVLARIVLIAPPAGPTFALQRGKRELARAAVSNGQDMQFEFTFQAEERAGGGVRFSDEFVQGPAGGKFIYVNSGTGWRYGVTVDAARQGQSRVVDLGNNQRGCCSARRTPRSQSLRSRQGRWAGVRFSSPSERRVAARYGLMTAVATTISGGASGRCVRRQGCGRRSDKCWT